MTMALLLVALFPAVPAEASGRALIAVLMSYKNLPLEETLGGFKDYLKGHGAGADYELFSLQTSDKGPSSPRFNEEVRSKNFLLILALGSPAVEVAGRQGGGLPIVASMVLSEEDIRRVPNATGVFLQFPLQTQFFWLHRILPDAVNVGVVYNPAENGARIRSATRIAAGLGLTLVPREVSTPQQLPEALKSLANHADVLWGVSDNIVVTPQTARSILLFSFRNRIPFIGLSTPWVKAGAFYALDRDYRDIGRQCAELARKVLNGAKAGALAPQPPRRVTFSLNLNTAERMKVEVPPSLRREAEKLF